MKNKIFAILAVLSLTLCCLAGCGNSKENMRTLPGEILNSEDNFTVITEQVLEIFPVFDGISGSTKTILSRIKSVPFNN